MRDFIHPSNKNTALNIDAMHGRKVAGSSSVVSNFVRKSEQSTSTSIHPARVLALAQVRG